MWARDTHCAGRRELPIGDLTVCQPPDVFSTLTLGESYPSYRSGVESNLEERRGKAES
jgi:hypothetical protein